MIPKAGAPTTKTTHRENVTDSQKQQGGGLNCGYSVMPLETISAVTKGRTERRNCRIPEALPVPKTVERPMLWADRYQPRHKTIVTHSSNPDGRRQQVDLHYPCQRFYLSCEAFVTQKLKSKKPDKQIQYNSLGKSFDPGVRISDSP
jgi:hypothetical protein